MSKSIAELVAEAKAQISEVSCQEVAAALKESPIIIDVREPMEFAGGCIGNAVNIPRGKLEFEIEPRPEVACKTHPALSDPNRPVYLYCHSDGRSALAAKRLQDLGFTRVYSMAGGIVAWQEAGLPITPVG
jgi:rhodanese-related sulfurtransferase